MSCQDSQSPYAVVKSVTSVGLFALLGFFLGKHHYGVDKIGNPFLAESKSLCVGSHVLYGLDDANIRIVVLCKDVVHRFLRHAVERLLHEVRQAELELHEVTHEHHQVLAEALELDKVGLDILHLEIGRAHV